MHNRLPFCGSQCRLVLALDLGAKFSGISYAIFNPGTVPIIQTVSRYPGQEESVSKISTIIYYDELDNVLAVGAEEPPAIEDDEDEEDAAAQTLELEWCASAPSVSIIAGIATTRTLEAQCDLGGKKNQKRILFCI